MRRRFTEFCASIPSWHHPIRIPTPRSGVVRRIISKCPGLPHNRGIYICDKITLGMKGLDGFVGCPGRQMAKKKLPKGAIKQQARTRVRFPPSPPSSIVTGIERRRRDWRRAGVEQFASRRICVTDSRHLHHMNPSLVHTNEGFLFLWL